MTDEDLASLDIVLQAITEARTETPGTTAFGKAIVLERQPKTPIWEIKPLNLLRILKELEEEEKIIALCLPEPKTPPTLLSSAKPSAHDIPAYNYYSKLVAGQMITPLQSTGRSGRFPTYEHPEGAPDLKAIHLRILDHFDNWHAAYLKRRSRSLEDLSQPNFEKILDLILEIDNRFQMKQNATVTVGNHIWLGEDKVPALWDSVDVNSNDTMTFRADAVEYLEDEGVILHFEVRQSYGDGARDSQLVLKIEVNKFHKFKARVEEIQTRRKNPAKEKPKFSEELPVADGQTVYEIKYTKAREVLLNNICLAKPDFDSENDNFFQFVFARPNQKISMEQLKKSVGGDFKKTLHKILENLGFTGDIRKVFFDVSKDALYFRNPIRKKDLEDLRIDRIKLSAK